MQVWCFQPVVKAKFRKGRDMVSRALDTVKKHLCKDVRCGSKDVSNSGRNAVLPESARGLHVYTGRTCCNDS